MKKKELSLVLTLALLPLIGLLALTGAWEGNPRAVLAQGPDGRDVYYVAPSCAGAPTPCYATVQEAVDAVDAPGEVIKVATGVYTGVQGRAAITQVVYISKSLTIRGGYTDTFAVTNPVSYPTTLDAQNEGRVMVVSGPATVTVEGLALTGGNANGLGGPSGYDAGSGVYIDGATVILSNTAIYTNAVTTYGSGGGGVAIDGGIVTIAGSAIHHNRAEFGSDGTKGSGVYAYDATLTMQGNHIHHNHGSVYGGGVYMEQNGVYTLTGNTIEQNTSSNGGGVYAEYTAGPVTFEGNTVRFNDAEGVALHPNSVQVRVIDNVIRGNSDAGLSLDGDGLTVTDNQIVGNEGGLEVASASGSGLIARNVISGNWALGGIDLIANNDGTSWVVADNVIVGNHDDTWDGGGGVLAQGHAITFRNNVIVDNSVTSSKGSGSGLLLWPRSSNPYTRYTYRLLHNTFSHNTNSAGIFIEDAYSAGFGAQVEIVNSIIAHHATGLSAGADSDVSIEGTLWYSNTTADTTGSIAHRAHDVTGDPAFAADGYHLSAGSAAEDAGLHTGGFWADFEGDPRPAGAGYDLGADEMADTALQLVKTPHRFYLAQGDTVTYTIVVTVAGGGATGLSLTDTLPSRQRPLSVDSDLGSCTLVGGYGGGATCDVGDAVAGTVVHLTLTAQMTDTAPAAADMPVPMTNTLMARAAEAGYMVTARTQFQSCFANLNGTVYDSVQDAVDAAGDGDLIKVAGYCSAFNARGTEIVYISKTVTLRGGYTVDDWDTSDPDANPTTFDGRYEGRGIVISGVGVAPTVENLHIIHGNARDRNKQGGGINIYRASPIIRNNVIEYNYGSYDDPAIAGGIGGQGGGIFVDQGEADPVIHDNIIQYNAAQTGGGIGTWECDETATHVLIQGNTISSNTALGKNNWGGGAAIRRCDADLIGNTFQGNTAYFGGGVYFDGGGDDEFSHNVVQDNTASGDGYPRGGGVYLDDVRMVMEGNTFVHNTADDAGGGLYTYNAQALDGANNAFVRNQGDGLYLVGHDADLYHTTVADNGGDGIYVYADGHTVMLTNTLIYSQAVGVRQTLGDVTLVRTLWDSVVAPIQGTVANLDPMTGTASLAADGYHLTASSDAIGQAVYTDVSDDVDGQPRPMGQFADIGADEYAYSVDLGLTKALGKQAPGSREAGEPISYTLTVTNAPNSQVRPDVLLVDTFTPADAVQDLSGTAQGGSCEPGGAVLTCTIGNVPTGTTTLVTIWVTTTINHDGVLTNTATLTPIDAVDTVPENDTARPVTVTVEAPLPDLWVAKTASADYAAPEETLVYAVTWGNRGGASASDVVLTDDLPADVTFVSAEGSPTQAGQTLTWDLGTATVDDGATYRVTTTVRAGTSDGTVLTNNADIDTTSAEISTGNNAASATTTVYETGGISMTVFKTADTFEAEVNDEIQYTIIVSNSGELSTTIELVDPIPDGTQYVSANSIPPGVFYSAAENEIVWTGFLTVSKSITVHLNVKVTECAGSRCGEIQNVAKVSADGTAYIWQALRDVRVLCPDLAVSLDAPTYYHYDEGSTTDDYYVTLTYRNNQLDDAWGDHSLAATPCVTLELQSAQATLDLAAGTPAPTTQAARYMVWENLPVLNPGEESNLNVIVKVGDFDSQGYVIKAGVEEQNGLPECPTNRANNTAAHTTHALTMNFKKQASQVKPVWVRKSGGGEELRFQVEYTMEYRYRNSHPDRPTVNELRLEDTWPAEAPLQWQDTDPDLDFLRSSQTELIWKKEYIEFDEGSWGWLRAKGQTTNPLTPLDTVNNSANLGFHPSNAGQSAYWEGASAAAEIPLVTPYIAKPFMLFGEAICPGNITISGLAQPETTIEIYRDGELYRDDVPVAADGTFNAEVELLETGNHKIYVRGRYFSHHSPPSREVNVSVTNKHWQAYESTWEGTIKDGPFKGQLYTFGFRDSNGHYSTDNFRVPGVYGFWDTQMHLRTCGCPNVNDTLVMTVTADGVDYAPAAIQNKRYDFNISGGAHNVQITSQCVNPNSGQVTSQEQNGGVVLIDPDGFVFDVDQGGDYDDVTGVFDPVQAVPDVTVTCMMSEPTLGGWVPWPAHMYDQTNPQVTDDTYDDGITVTGYYAFFTPPGHYYLQVEDIAGYQAWRSPVVEVITQIVHVNVPYTPWVSDTDVYSVTMLPAQLGPGTLWNGVSVNPPVVTVPVGSAVTWMSALSDTNTIDDLIKWSENPIFRVLSERDPLKDTLGFDAGMLEPGRVYQRQFSSPGVYTYTAYGYTGRVVVTKEEYDIYLPLVTREYSP